MRQKDDPIAREREMGTPAQREIERGQEIYGDEDGKQGEKWRMVGLSTHITTVEFLVSATWSNHAHDPFQKIFGIFCL